MKNHKKYFVDDDNSQADSKGLGAAAAMQALKKFNSGEEDTKGSSGSSMQKFLSLAMAEASKVSSSPTPYCTLLAVPLEPITPILQPSPPPAYFSPADTEQLDILVRE